MQRVEMSEVRVIGTATNWEFATHWRSLKP